MGFSLVDAGVGVEWGFFKALEAVSGDRGCVDWDGFLDQEVGSCVGWVRIFELVW